MSDASVAAALHSTAPLVVIEAPAGCGKTHQGAAYARDMAQGTRERLLIITHIQAFDRLMSMPVTPDEKTSYLLTQLLAEVLLRRGFDGVRFRSSVSDGINICVFHPAKFEFAEGHSEVRRLESVKYDAPAVPSLVEPSGEDHLLKG